MDDLKRYIREVPDFPKPGINFYDITTLLKDPLALRMTVDRFGWLFVGERVDKVVGIESRGFMFAPIVASTLNAGFVPVRKPGKLPARTVEPHLRARVRQRPARDARRRHRARRAGADRRRPDRDRRHGARHRGDGGSCRRRGGGLGFVIELPVLAGRSDWRGTRSSR